MQKKLMYPNAPIYIVDDEESWLKSISISLNAHGINNIQTCNDSRKVLEQIDENDFSLILLDLTMPHVSGFDLLTEITERKPELPIIVITGADVIEYAIKSMKLGAYDYFIKTAEEDKLLTGIKHAIEYSELKQECINLSKYMLNDTLTNPEAYKNIITNDRKMRAIFQYLESVAHSSHPVLITGESGVGKELIANAIHQISQFKDGPFVAVNLAGLDDNMLSDTLFGHVKGAYTGADSNRSGLIDTAAGGTILLDEIGDLSLPSQVKLLRLLQEREYFNIGADLPKRANVRIIVSTNKDLREQKQQGKFRNDLFYRLNTHHIHIPPLRERLSDIPFLLDHFIQKSCKELNKNIPTYPKELPILLKNYTYPGNVRELESMVNDAIHQHKSKMLSMEVFISYIENATGSSDAICFDSSSEIFASLDVLPTIKEATQELINEAIKRAENNQSIAAKMLGITRQALNQRLLNQ